MHTLNDALVPVLRRFIFRVPDGENRRSYGLSSKLSNFSIAKGLSERWEPLEEIGEMRHRQNDEVVLTTNQHQ